MDIDSIFSAFDDNPKENSLDVTSTPENVKKSLKQLGKILKKKRKAKASCENEGSVKKVKVEKQKILDNPEIANSQPKIQVQKVKNVDGCSHEVAFPEDYPYEPIPNTVETPPAKNFPFELDMFQKEAVLCLESNHSVLVSAHTSAGKTVVAEYAIAMSLARHQKVIYTTPIKALSNQKYREFAQEFGDVGLMTGDVTINDTASCLIMTTEILRNMLYRGSDTLKGMAWVIFDEIHYMRDKDRGVVWEESLILLPNLVRMVFLSATIPNGLQFAQWISWLHQQPCHVISTSHRPVPLEFYVHPVGGDGLFQIMDEHKAFYEGSLRACLSKVEQACGTGQADRFRRGKKGGTSGMSSCAKVINAIKERQLLPAIAFSFSRKECELYAKEMAYLRLNTQKEQESVGELYKNAVDLLSDEDKKLPQVVDILPFLRNGIGIHHGGLLPLVKELIELLFSEGLIKVLFATETFAMGLNMPARTVLFTCMKKYDGESFRFVLPGEFIQMSGRAGRRGLDQRGTVIINIDQEVSTPVIQHILQGSPDPLNSAFHLTDNMILHMLRLDGQKPEDIMERSFRHFQKLQEVPELYTKMSGLSEEKDQLPIQSNTEIDRYLTLQGTLSQVEDKMASLLLSPAICQRFLVKGRVIRVQVKDKDFGWCFCLSSSKAAPKQKRPSRDKTEELRVEVLMAVKKTFPLPVHINQAQPSTDEDVAALNANMMIYVVSCTEVAAITPYISKTLPPIRSPATRKEALIILQAVREKLASTPVSPLDIVQSTSVDHPEYQELDQKRKDVKKKLSKCSLASNAEALVPLHKKRKELTEEIEAIKVELKQKKELLEMEELRCQKRIFHRLGFVDENDVVMLKGKVACEISSGHELLLIEMLLNGMFTLLEPHAISALLSCIVFEENVNDQPSLPPELEAPYGQMKELAEYIYKVSVESRKDIDKDQMNKTLRPNLMPIVYEWSKGATFAKICDMTEIFEGTIIRSLRRLHELLSQMFNASVVIGNNVLERKFTDCITFIKRDIVFAASLYI